MKNAICVLILGSVISAAPAVAATFSIGTNPEGSSAYSTGAAVARVAKDKLDLRARVVPQGGPVVTLPLVNRGQLNASIANSVVTSFAYQGRAMFKGKPQKDVRVVAVLRTLRLGVLVRKDSKIKTLADLKGTRVSSDFAKQRIQHIFWSAILAMPGLSYKDVQKVPVPNGVRAVDDFTAGKVDSTMFSITSGKVRQAFASVDARYVPMLDDPAAVKRAQAISPGIIIETVNPSAAYAGVTGPTKIMAAPFIVTAGAKEPEDGVYKLTKALAENKKLMVSVFKGMGEFDEKKMFVDFGVPYHPGAMKYYRETGQAK